MTLPPESNSHVLLLITRCKLCAYLHTVACVPAMHILMQSALGHHAIPMPNKGLASGPNQGVCAG